MRRSTRKSSIGAENARNPVGNFSTRFSLPSFVKRMEKLTDGQKSAIKRIGFGNLLGMPTMTLNKNLLAELMERWSCQKLAFILPPGEITITLMDVALILGLRVKGELVVLKEDESFSELEQEYGATFWKRKITVSSIESRLEALGGTDNDDFIRTFLLFTFGTFLFPNANAKVDSRYLSLLKDLENVCKFAWGAAVLENLFEWLCKRKESNVQYVGSCLIFLQIWSYEHIDIARPSLVDCYFTFPRACRWENSRTSHQRQWFTTRFKELQGNQINRRLQLTSQESEIDIIKELLETQNGKEELPTPQDTSNHISVVNEDILRIGSHSMDQLDIELNSGSEAELVEEEEGEQEDMVQLRVSENVPEAVANTMECPSTSHYMSETQNKHIECPSTSLDSCTYVTNLDDLRTRNLVLEERNMELKKEIEQLRRENELLRDQLLSNSLLEEQNVELKKEVDDLRKENLLLSSSSNNLVVRLEKLLFDEDINATEES